MINNLPKSDMGSLPARGEQFSQSGCARNELYDACVSRAQEYLDASGINTGAKTVSGTVIKNTVIDIIKNSRCTTYCGAPPLPGGRHYPLDDVIPPLQQSKQLKEVNKLRKSLPQPVK